MMREYWMNPPSALDWWRSLVAQDRAKERRLRELLHLDVDAGDYE